MADTPKTSEERAAESKTKRVTRAVAKLDTAIQHAKFAVAILDERKDSDELATVGPAVDELRSVRNSLAGD